MINTQNKSEAILNQRISKLEDQLARAKLETTDLVFDLKVAKTKVAVLEEKLACQEIDQMESARYRSPLLSPPTEVQPKVNVTVHNNNYGCFGIGGYSSLKVILDKVQETPEAHSDAKLRQKSSKLLVPRFRA